jgi:bacterioferritin-associated ferredoxin
VIVCHCRAVSDRAIRAAIREGATTVDAVSAETGANSCCGGCEPTVARILAEELGAQVTTGAAAPDSSLRPARFRPLRVVRNPEAA